MNELIKKIDFKKVAIFTAIALVLFYIWYSGKKSGMMGKPTTVPVPEDFITYDEAGNITSQSDGGKIRRLSTQMHDEMNSTWGSAAHAPFTEFSQLSDTNFTLVYNDFNERFNSEGSGTLKQWIIDAYYDLIR